MNDSPETTSYRVLVADDNESIRSLLARLCRQLGWESVLLEDGYKADELLAKEAFDIYVIDVKMPGPSGVDLANRILQSNETASVLILTGFAEIPSVVEAMSMGVFNYVQKDSVDIKELQLLLLEAADFHDKRTKAFQAQRKRESEVQDIEAANQRFQTISNLLHDFIFVLDADTGMILDCNLAVFDRLGYSHEEIIGSPIERFEAQENGVKQLSLPNMGTNDYPKVVTCNFVMKDGIRLPVEISYDYICLDTGKYFSVVARDITDRLKQEEEKRANMLRLHDVLIQTIQVISNAVEKRDPYTAGHQQRVAKLSKAIGLEIGLDSKVIEGLYLGALIHDVGKLAIPAEILSKPTRLMAEEFNIIKLHTTLGYQIVEQIDFPWPIKEMVLQHHERLDGSGYPHGVTDDKIILESRIIGVADVVEAMSSHRPYRPALPFNLSMEEIESKKNTHYDAEIVDACVILFKEKEFSF